MWIILLDCSGSMADPFEAVGLQLQGRIRKFEAKVKLEAAKKAVLFQLSRLDEETDVILFGFTSTVEEICAGRAGEVARFDRELAGVEAHNGTDIAAALGHAVAYVSARPDITMKPAVLLISDGKSDVDEAKAAAHNCVSAGLRVDMLVIDPTDEGMQMARAIMQITKGQLERVTSADEMLTGTSEAADRFAREAAQTEAILRGAEQEFVADREEVRTRPEASFTAGYPKIIARGRNYPLQVYVHLSALIGEVERLLREQLAPLGGALATSTADAALPIARGRLITAQPNIRNIFANPPRHEIVWMDDYHRLDFQISYAGQDPRTTVCGGFVDIFVDGLIVAQIPVSISVPAKGAEVPADGAAQVETVKMLSRIFASYAHEDDALVRACKTYYRTLGIHMYVDRDELLSGNPWRATLAKLMEKSDLFQLYWSQAAADSTEVANEWQVALDLGKARPWDFVRPLYWQKPMPAAPAALKEINFGFLDLNTLKLDLDAALRGTTLKPFEQAEHVAALFPIIPLEQDASSETVEHLQEALKRVVPFLENLAGLRYYPPPTLLVDEYTITQVRSRVTVDKSKDDLSDKRVSWALDVLQSLALTFHVSKLEPEGVRYNDDQVRQFYRLITDEAYSSFSDVRRASEYIFHGPVKAYVKGDERGSSNFPDLPSYLQRYFDHWLDYVKVSEQHQGDVPIEIGYSLPLSSLEEFGRRFPSVPFRVGKKVSWQRGPEPEYVWSISLSNFHRAIAVLRDVILDRLHKPTDSRQKLKTYFLATVATFGVFVSARLPEAAAQLAELASRNGWPNGVSLVGSHKTLLSVKALERYRKSLVESGVDEPRAGQMARDFLTSTLVHEHFHGIAETGVDRQGRASAAWDIGGWESGSNLNEALAAWVQRHYFRNDAETFRSITEYINEGEYPEWPYRGAETVEKIFQEKGLPGVRTLIAQLRDDPSFAQDSFDAFVAQTG